MELNKDFGLVPGVDKKLVSDSSTTVVQLIICAVKIRRLPNHKLLQRNVK